jgi:ankyrin repeat protein
LTPLALAINNENLEIVKLEIVKLLLKKGADSNIGDNVSILLCAGDAHPFYPSLETRYELLR